MRDSEDLQYSWKILAFDLQTETCLWEYASEEEIFIKEVAGGILLVQSPNAMHAIDAQTGKLRWQKEKGGDTFSFLNIKVNPGIVYMFSEPNNSWFANELYNI